MKRILQCGVLLVLASCLVTGVYASDLVTEVKSLTDRALKSFKTKGREYTLKLINAKGPFIKGSLYVFAVSMDNKVLAEPFYKHYVGKDLSDMKDVNGDYYMRECQRIAKEEGSGWCEFWWLRHGEKKPTLKRVYVKKVPDEDIYLVAGYYVK